MIVLKDILTELISENIWLKTNWITQNSSKDSKNLMRLLTKFGIKRIKAYNNDLYGSGGYKQLSTNKDFLTVISNLNAKLKSNTFDTDDGFEITFK